MTLIRVDPPLLRESSQKIDQVGTQASRVGDQLARISSNAPGYDGQFGPRVSLFGTEAAARARACVTRLAELGTRLRATADAFEAVDLVSLSGWQGTARQMEAWQTQHGPWSRLAQALILPGYLADMFFKLGSLLGWPGSQPGVVVPVAFASERRLPAWLGQTFQGWQLPWRKPVPAPATPGPIVTELIAASVDHQIGRDFVVQTAEMETERYVDIAADIGQGRLYMAKNPVVAASINKYTDQCTAYVAYRRQDIQAAPHGKDWLEQNKRLGTGDEPRRGAILVQGAEPGNPYGHVAYVEYVNADGTIVISEQNRPLGSPPTVRIIDPSTRNVIGYIY